MQDLRHSRLYSEELGIDLKKNSDGELFKWFLAATLFGARISERIAANTYRSFERHALLTPKKILAAGWDFLVNPIMREGGYVRYDERTSRQLLKDCEMLENDYGGSLKRLHAEAKNESDLEGRLQRFYGVGPVTANIFLRELRAIWPKADPEPLPVIERQARMRGFDIKRIDRKTMAFIRLEAGLFRARKDLKEAA